MKLTHYFVYFVRLWQLTQKLWVGNRLCKHRTKVFDFMLHIYVLVFSQKTVQTEIKLWLLSISYCFLFITFFPIFFFIGALCNQIVTYFFPTCTLPLSVFTHCYIECFALLLNTFEFQMLCDMFSCINYLLQIVSYL